MSEKSAGKPTGNAGQAEAGQADPTAAYFAAAPQPQRQTLLAMWSTLQELLPTATPAIAYGVPCLKVAGKGVAGLAHYPQHCSYLPMSGSITSQLATELADYKTSKGAVQVPLGEPLPRPLIELLVHTRQAEIAAKGR